MSPSATPTALALAGDGGGALAVPTHLQGWMGVPAVPTALARAGAGAGSGQARGSVWRAVWGPAPPAVMTRCHREVETPCARPRCQLGGEGVRSDGRPRPFANSPRRAGGAGVASRSRLRVGAFRFGADEAAGQTAAAAGGPGAGSRRCRRQFCAKRMSSESDVAPTRSHVSFLSGYSARCRMHRSIRREECDRRRVCAASRAPKTRLLKGRCALWKDARWFSPGTVRETCHLPSCRWPAVESSFLVCFKHRQVRVSQLFGASVLGHRTWPNISC